MGTNRFPLTIFTSPSHNHIAQALMQKTFTAERKMVSGKRSRHL